MEEKNKQNSTSQTKADDIPNTELQCEKCLHKLVNQMIITEYPFGKPAFVLTPEQNCLKLRFYGSNRTC